MKIENLKLKITLPLLFVFAILLGFLQRKNLADFSFGSRSTITKFSSPSADSLEGYYKKGQEAAMQQGQKQSIMFLAGGDIMLSRSVAATMDKAQDSYLPYRGMAEILKSTDFNFANLESPFTYKNCAAVSGGHSMIFGASCQSIEGFNEYNFKILNLANNHAMDQGVDGLLLTKESLQHSGIQTEGTGKNLDEAWQPAVVEANGFKICFIGASYASINDNGKAKSNYVARIEDTDRLKSAVTTAKSKCNFTVVTMHAGTEYTRTPNASQIAFAHAAIDDGADIVIGAHPHWVQTIEKYDGKYIFYSLGNFIFDQEWSQDTKEGLALKITLSKTGTQQSQVAPRGATINDLQGPKQQASVASIELIPLVLENYSTPRPATPEESKKILEKIGETENILK